MSKPKASSSAAAAPAAPAALYVLASEKAAKIRTGIDTAQRNMDLPKVVWRTSEGGIVQRGTNRGRVVGALQALGNSFTLQQAIEALAALQASDPNALGAGGKPSGWVKSWVRKGLIVTA